MATIKSKPITLFVPFSKIERRAEDDAMIVEGYCFVNPTVKGDRYSIKRSAMEAATPEYLQFPAVREMHQPHAVGTGLEVVWDERGCLLRSECVDEGTKKKIDRKVLRGYSIGITPGEVNRADEVESLTWIETSYVDRPKDPDAVFLYRVEGFDPEAEVDVTVLDDPPAAGDSAQRIAHSAQRDPAEAVRSELCAVRSSAAEAPSAAPTGESPSVPAADAAEGSPVPGADAIPPTSSSAANPEELSSGGEGRADPPEVSSTGEERAPVGDATRLWSTLAPDIAEDVTPEERRALLSETLIGLGVAEPIAQDMAARVDVMAPVTPEWLSADRTRQAVLAQTHAQGTLAREEIAARAEAIRALDSGDVPVRENLEGRRPRGFQAIHAERQPEMLAGGIMDAHTSLAHSLYSILDSDADDKPGLIKQSVAEYADHVNGLCKKRMQRAEGAQELREELAALTRADKPEGDDKRAAAVETERAEIAALLERSTTTWASLDPEMQKTRTRGVPGGCIQAMFSAMGEKAYWQAMRRDEAGLFHRVGRFATPEEATTAVAAAVEAARVGAGDGRAVDAQRLPSSEKPDVLPANRASVEAPRVPWEVIAMAGGGFALKNTESGDVSRYESRLAAEQRLLEITRDAKAEAFDGLLSAQISRSDGREEMVPVTRLRVAESDLARVSALHEEAVTRLGAAEAEVKRLGALPMRKRPVINAYAADREFLERYQEDGQADVAAIKALYERAMVEAQTAPDAGTKREAMNRMISYKEDLRRLGVTV